MRFEYPISTDIFARSLMTNKENWRLLLCIFIATQCQFAIFSIFYPLPNFMPPDSYSYLKAAYFNEDINMLAIGYSKFLRLFSCLTPSAHVLIWFQYTLLEASICYFLFSIKYFFTIDKWFFRILAVVCILNPLFIHISNFVSSDSLFTSLSLIWFTQLCWILYRPKLRLLLLHAVILTIAFTIRYNALYYPAFSIIAIIVTSTGLKNKILGIGSIALLLSGFIVKTEIAYNHEVGMKQFSAFGGWQIAANALYGYAYTKPDAPGNVPFKFRKLQETVNRHMDSIRAKPAFMRPDKDVGVYYQWDFKSPLRLYVDEVWNKDTTTPYFKRWASMGQLYSSYGGYLILHHPAAFAEHFLWPNLIRYYVPPAGFMGSYVNGDSLSDPIVAVWFKWKTTRVYNLFKTKDIQIVKIFPPLLGGINLLFALSAIAFIIAGGFSRISPIKATLTAWMIVIWLSNMTFSVFSAPIELRYQLFPMTITLVFLTLMLSFLIKESRSTHSIRTSTQIAT